MCGVILYIDLDIRLCFLWFIYNRLIIFYNELTHLAPKKKKKTKKTYIRWDMLHKLKLYLKFNFYTRLTHLAQKFKNLD